MAKIKITQIRSLIDTPSKQRRVIKALGIHKLYNSVVKEDTPTIKGMIAKVSHLVTVEEVNN